MTPETLQTEVIDSIVRKEQQRLEYTLRGAWRAGYAYVHVYRPQNTLTESVSTNKIIRGDIYEPTDTRKPRSRELYDYIYTYDLLSVSDEAVKEAISEQ